MSLILFFFHKFLRKIVSWGNILKLLAICSVELVIWFCKGFFFIVSLIGLVSGLTDFACISSFIVLLKLFLGETFINFLPFVVLNLSSGFVRASSFIVCLIGLVSGLFHEFFWET